MGTSVTLHSLLDAALSGPEWDEIFRWGSGSQRSDVVKHVAGRIVRSRWEPSTGLLPRQRAPLAADTAEMASALIIRLLPTIKAAVQVQRKVVQAATAAAQELGLRASPADLSEPSCSAVGTAYAQEPPESVDVIGLGRDLAMARACRPVRLEKPEFVAKYLAMYQTRWADQGAASLAAYPPAQIGLGRNAAPPFVASRNENSWLLGTDRSVWGRYRLHFLQTSRSCSAERYLHAGDECAVEEVDRTCQGYGLTELTHRVVLRSVSTASVDADPAGVARSHRVWNSWREDSHAIAVDGTVDDALVDATAAKIALWFHYARPAKEMVDRHGQVDRYFELVSRALVRKLWMGLHRLEREHKAPATSDDVNPLLFAALDNAVPEAVTVWLTEGSSTAPSAGRINATTTLLVSHPDLAVRLTERAGPETLAEYAELARIRFGKAWPEQVLTQDELKALIDRHPESEE